MDVFAEPEGSGRRGMKEQLHSALKELVKLRVSEKELRARLSTFGGECSPASTVADEEVEHLRRRMRIVEEERDALERELRDARGEAAARTTELLREADQHRTALEELQATLQQEKTLRSTIHMHLKHELSNLLELVPTPLQDSVREMIDRLSVDYLPQNVLAKLSDMSAMSKQLMALNLGLSQYEQRIEELESFLNRKTTEEADLRRQLDAVTRALRDAEAQLENSKDASQDWTRKQKNAELAVKELTLERDMLKAALESAVHKASERAEDLEKEFEKAKSQWLSSNDSEVQNLRADVERLTKQLTDELRAWTTEKAQYEIRLEELQAQVGDKAREIAALEEALLEAVSKSKETSPETVAELEKQLASQTLTTDQLSQQIRSLEQQLETEQTGSAEAHANLSDAQGEMVLLRDQVAESQTALQSMETQLSDLRCELEHRVDELRVAQAAAEEARADAAAAVAEAEAAWAQASNAKAEAQRVWAKQTHTVQTVVNEDHTACENERASLLSQLSAAELQVELSRARETSLRAELESLREAGEEASEAAAEMQRVRAEAEEQARAEAEKRIRAEAASEAHAAMERVREETRVELERQLGELRAELDAQTPDDDLQSKLTEKEAALETVREELERLKEETDELREAHEQSQEALRDAQEQAEQAQRAVERKDEDLVQLEGTLTTLRGEIESLQRDIEDNQVEKRWSFPAALLEHVENARKLSSSMANINLGEKCTAEKTIAKLRKCALYFASESEGLRKTISLLKEREVETQAVITRLEEAAAAAKAEHAARVHAVSLDAERIERQWQATRDQLAREKSRRVEAEAEVQRLTQNLEDAVYEAQKRAADLQSELEGLQRAPAVAASLPSAATEPAAKAETPAAAVHPNPLRLSWSIPACICCVYVGIQLGHLLH